AGSSAEADRTLSEYRDRLSDLHVRALGCGDPRRGDVREQNALLIRHVVGDLREVGLRVRNAEVLGLDTVDRVAKPPRADHLPVVLVAGALSLVVRLAVKATAT